MAMEFSGEYASPARVWEALDDPAVLQGCITGCKSLERTSANEFTAVVNARVGTISATLKGNVVLSDLDPTCPPTPWPLAIPSLRVVTTAWPADCAKRAGVSPPSRPSA
jgi:hypothetical protein